MTSEILIMNKSSIVLAADTTVTVGSNTYVGVEKIFKVSDDVPFAVMVYNNSEFMKIPFQALLSEYCKKLSKDEKNDIVKFKDGLINFLSRNSSIFKKEDVIDEINNFKHEIIKKVEKYGIDYVCEWLNSFSNEEILPFLDDFNQEFGEILSSYEISADLLKKCFSDKLRSFGTYVVICGFNGDDFYPSLILINLLFNYEGEIVYEILKLRINRERALFLPLAQKDTIETILTGLDSTVKESLLSYFRDFVENFPNEIVYKLEISRNFSEEVMENICNEVENLKNDVSIECVKEYLHYMDNISKFNSASILNSIAFLPINDLCQMAESLINMTALKIKISSKLKTVGGNIDVVYITKDKGFKWYNKKV